MEQAHMLLLAELPGLEAAKIAIERRIDEIKVRLSAQGEYIRPPAVLDPTILGRDILGRIKRKRNLSPELREKKRELMAAARQKRLDGLAGASTTSPAPRPAEPIAAVPMPTTKRKKG